jgi:uncharacterized phiE125 gp8 family phage protein
VAYVLTTPPAEEPLTLDEAKLHLRIVAGDTAEDALVTSAVQAAREYAEESTGRALVTQTWTLTMDAFPTRGGAIALERAPVQSVTSVKYIDAAGTEQALTAGTDYVVDAASEPARIALAPDAMWPSTQSGRINAVTVVFVAGYGLAAAVPEILKGAMKLHVGDMHEHREETAIGTIVSPRRAVEDIYARYRYGGHVS